MTLPSALFGLVCALLIGSLFHLVVDGGPGRLLLYTLLSTLGFIAGQWLADSQHWTLIPVGPLQLGAGILGSALFLVAGHWLSKVNVEAADRNGRV